MFSPAQLNIVTRAMRLAAERFSEDAFQADIANHPRLAEQFRKQAKETRDVLRMRGALRDHLMRIL